jgi:hypothetical protein
MFEQMRKKQLKGENLELSPHSFFIAACFGSFVDVLNLLCYPIQLVYTTNPPRKEDRKHVAHLMQ